APPLHRLRHAIPGRGSAAGTLPDLRGRAAVRPARRPVLDDARPAAGRPLQRLADGSAGPLRGADLPRLRHQSAGAAGPHAGGQPALGLRGAAGRRDRGAGAGAGRAGGRRHLPPALLHDHGRVGPRLRRPGLAARGRPGACGAARPVPPLLAGRNATGAAGGGAAPAGRPLRWRDGGALVARGRRAAGGRRHAGAARPEAPRLHAELPLPDPATAGRGAAHGGALRGAGVRRDPWRLRRPRHHGGRASGAGALGGALLRLGGRNACAL
ncbi:MAG: beta-lactamase-like protein, partial [uncultured Acetobacteraceae bacterium]